MMADFDLMELAPEQVERLVLLVGCVQSVFHHFHSFPVRLFVGWLWLCVCEACF